MAGAACAACGDKKWQKQTDGDECRQILRPSASAENEDTKLDRWVSTSIATTLGLPKGDKTPASTLALSPAQLLPWETTLIS